MKQLLFIKKRASANEAERMAWQPSDLLFITASTVHAVDGHPSQGEPSTAGRPKFMIRGVKIGLKPSSCAVAASSQSPTRSRSSM